MKWCNALSDEEITELALEDIVARVRDEIDPSLLVAFASAQHGERWHLIAETLAEAFPEADIIGCSGGGIIGEGRELEGPPAISVTAAQMDATVHVEHLDDEGLPEGAAAWRARLELDDRTPSGLVLLTDPYSFDTESCLAQLDDAFPGVPVVGGVASGALVPRGAALFAGDRTHREGAVIASFEGVTIEPLIAQGCKPIGEPMMVSSCEGNVIHGLDQKAPGEVIQGLYDSLEGDERLLFRTSLFLGIEMRDQREYQAGDFLVRNLLGLDEDGGAMAVGALLERWQVVQFHLRDRDTAKADLQRQLERYRDMTERPAGGLLFSCLGRGRGLFGEPHHDVRAFLETVGDIPLGGFFCNGEIGPVGQRTFLHGYTSAFALFR